MIAPRARLGFVALLSVSAVLVAHAPPSPAQYMYLDSNGDGIHTPADQVNAAGFTVVDIWLDTDSNRDGIAAVCPTEPGALLSLGSYVISLGAVNGTIQWGNYTNQLPNAVVQFFHGSTPTEYWNGFGAGPPGYPPGRYRLGTLTFSVASGTPSIEIIPRASGTPRDDTSFGSACPGLRFDHTIRLGEEWHDADGLAFGGGASHAPVLASVEDMTLPAGESSSQALRGTDADGQPLAFTMTAGPSYGHVITLDAGAGAASGAFYAAPFASDVGAHEVVIAVSDGATSVQETFTSTVVPSSNHDPSARVPRMIAIAAGTTRRVPLGGGDSDGQPLHWRLVSGPGFAGVLDLQARPGGGAGVLELTPGLCDVGPAVAVVGVTDGALETRFEVDVQVLPALAAPLVPLHTAQNLHGPVALATGDFNHDGMADMATANGAGNSVTIFQTQPSGEIQSLGDIATGDVTVAVLPGDVDGDGSLDLIALNAGSIQVLIGSGQGTFASRPEHPAGNSPLAMVSDDLNRDGFLDLTLVNSGSDDLSVLLGQGDGTFVEAPRVHVGGNPAGLATGDFNLDGRLDLAVTIRAIGEVRVLNGFGNGTFAVARSIPVGGMPEEILSGDWNGDGLTDLAVVNLGTRSTQIVLGQTDATFELVGSLPVFPVRVTSGDVDSDGNEDLVLTVGTVGSELQIFRGAGDGTFPIHDVFPSPDAFAVGLDDANRDGFPDAFLTSIGHGEVRVRLSRYGGAGAAQATSRLKNQRPVTPGRGSASVCILLEPIGGSYQNTDVLISSLRLRSPGTGSVGEILPIQNSVVETDSDRNGVMEISICFAQADLSRLFDQTEGRQSVIARLQGGILDGRRFCSNVRLEVIGGGGGGPLAATVSPNPLNPRATLRFSTSRDGAVKVRMYDLHGRVVRALLDRPALPAGSHDVEIDGRAQNGQTLASGIYFYEVEATEGTVRGRLTILK